MQTLYSVNQIILCHTHTHTVLWYRLEAIAADAELQEKSLSELQRLMTVLREGAMQAEKEHRHKYVLEYMLGVSLLGIADGRIGYFCVFIIVSRLRSFTFVKSYKQVLS